MRHILSAEILNQEWPTYRLVGVVAEMTSKPGTLQIKSLGAEYSNIEERWREEAHIDAFVDQLLLLHHLRLDI